VLKYKFHKNHLICQCLEREEKTMNARRRILMTVMLVLLLTAGLVPISNLLSSEDAQEEHVVLQTLLDYRQHKESWEGILVEPLMDIEDVWDIEDTRIECEEPLVTKMLCNGAEMGYDRKSRTFYCTLGMRENIQWGSYDIFAEKDTELIRVAWVDDYAYDDCAEAIREGYRYELIAYNEEYYEYIGVVFTGLPMVTLHIPSIDELSEEYVPARVSISSAEYDPVDTAALTHLRGGGYHTKGDKDSYRLQFHNEFSGEKDRKSKISVLGMEEDSDWLLLSNRQDSTCVRNYLSFDMWKRWNEDGNALMQLDSRLVELCVNDTYMGIYQLMQRVRPEIEIERAGGDVDKDCLVRLVAALNVGEKPWLDLSEESGFYVEYRYEACDNAKRAFDYFKNYSLLNQKDEKQIDDALFEELVLRHVDIDNVISYYLFMQACGLVIDNSFNNLYIWTFFEDDHYKYRLAPWDMDGGFPTPKYVNGYEVYERFNTTMVMPRRMLDLDVGNCREKLWKLWEEKRNTLLLDDALYSRFMEMEEWINRSGSYRRESERWHGDSYELDVSGMLHYELEQMEIVERSMNEYWPL